MNVTEVYEDRARSGGSIMGRDSLLRLMDRTYQDPLLGSKPKPDMSRR